MPHTIFCLSLQVGYDVNDFRMALGFVCGICEAAFDSEDAFLGHLDSQEHMKSMSGFLQRESLLLASCVSAWTRMSFLSVFSLLMRNSFGPWLCINALCICCRPKGPERGGGAIQTGIQLDLQRLLPSISELQRLCIALQAVKVSQERAGCEIESQGEYRVRDLCSLFPMLVLFLLLLMRHHQVEVHDCCVMSLLQMLQRLQPFDDEICICRGGRGGAAPFCPSCRARLCAMPGWPLTGWHSLSR